jgi:hypothetical protein
MQEQQVLAVRGRVSYCSERRITLEIRIGSR